jgi:acyl-CoA hydrolase
MTEELVTRRRVRPIDLNAANRLFGGQLMLWIDESAAIYAMYKLKTTNVVTARISEVNFRQPVLQGDFLEFFASTVKYGRTSITVRMTVEVKRLDDPNNTVAADCELVFVAIDTNGKPTPYLKDPKGMGDDKTTP